MFHQLKILDELLDGIKGDVEMNKLGLSSLFAVITFVD